MERALEKLVKKAKKGDRDAFIALMEAQKLSMSRVALAILHNEEDAADAIGETVLTAFARLSTLREPRFFQTWLTRVLMDHCRDRLREQKRWVPLDALPEAPARGTDVEQSLDVRQSLAELAENDRLVLTLFYLDGLKIREIAGLLGVKEGTVKTRLMRGRKRFKQVYLGKEGDCT